MIFFAITALFGVLAATEHLLFILALFSIFILFLMKKKKYRRVHIILILFTFLLFFMKTVIEEKMHLTSFSGTETVFQLHVEDLARFNGDQLTISVEEKNTSEKLLVKYNMKTEEEKRKLQKYLAPGQTFNVKGILKDPPISTNENAFDYQIYLRRNHISWILWADKLELVDEGFTPNILQAIKIIRLHGIHHIETYFSEETVPLAIALIFGSSDFISADLMDDYRELGIIHLLAISGLHISIIVAIIYFLLLRVGVTREKSLMILLFCLPVYSILAGASPSVIRSVLMTMLIIVGKRWGEFFSIKTVDAISITFLLYVFTSPYAIYHIGFQLSFLVTYTLLISSPYLLKRYSHPLSLLFATSLLSTVCSAPLLLYYFFEFSLISVVVNIIYIPLFNIVILPFLLLVFILSLFIKDFFTPFLHLLNVIIVLTNTLTEKIAGLPWNTVVLGRPANLYCAVYLCGIYLFFTLWEKEKRGFIQKAGLIFFPILLFTGQFFLQQFNPNGEITFIDVGQGDAIYIRLPFGRGNYLIDTGGNVQWQELNEWQKKEKPFDVGRDVVVQFLKSKGVTKLDKLIITHGDADHAGGAEAVLKNIKVRELVLPDRLKYSEFEKELIEKVKKEKISLRFVHQGDSWSTSQERFLILAPQEKTIMEGNNASIVLYTNLGGQRWLFTGDLEKEGENLLMEKYPTLSVDVLKAGHHGSKSSTTEPFIKQMKPKIAVISVGENNRFKHPHTEVIARLEKHNIHIMRTDTSGAITYTFAKKTGTFSLHNP